MVLWTVSQGESPHTLAEETPLLEPLFHFSNVHGLPTDCAERVRSLAYNKYTLVSLKLVPCTSSQWWVLARQLFVSLLGAIIEPSCWRFQVHSMIGITLYSSTFILLQELGSLQTNPCGASVHFWDVYTLQQVCQIACSTQHDTLSIISSD